MKNNIFFLMNLMLKMKKKFDSILLILSIYCFNYIIMKNFKFLIIY